MSQVQGKIEDQVRRLSADVGGDAQPGSELQAAETPSEGGWVSHTINLRISIPLLVGRYYVTLVAGKERRAPDRRSEERRKHPLFTFGNLAVIFFFGSICGLSLLALLQLAGVYVLTETGIMVVPQ